MGFLIDTKATRNFIDPMMVEKLHLKELSVDSFEVTVARGEKVGVHCCRGMKINIQGQERNRPPSHSIGRCKNHFGNYMAKEFGTNYLEFFISYSKILA